MAEDGVVVLNATIYAWQKEVLEAFRRQENCLTTSEALRRLLTLFDGMTDERYRLPQAQEQPA